jgi:short subunit fatty acids transporter
MTQPPVVPQPQAAPGDKVTLWGVLGIVFSVCCWPLGLVFDVLGLMEAKKVGKQPTLAYIGFGLAALFAILSILQWTVGLYSMN